MNIIVRNVLAVIAGWLIGSVVNIALILLGDILVLPPAGVDMKDMESIRSSAHLFETRHFIFPLVAHAAGALIGALMASLIGGSKRMVLALIVGGLFLLGGIWVAFVIPAPAWFIAVDILLAYIPMAWIGWKLSGKG